MEVVTEDNGNMNSQSTPLAERNNKTGYSDEVAEIILNKKAKDKKPKKN
jgi:hypothetical protein